MATVYSLVCWGGKDGKAVTAASASTNRFTLANHGLRTGTGIVPQTSFGGLTAGTTYYSNVTKTGATANEFYVYDTYADAIAGGAPRTLVATTGTFKSAYYVGLGDKSRWTYMSEEYIYNGLVAWFTDRKTSTDYEVCEIGEAFTDSITGGALTLLAEHFTGGSLITTLVNGSRSPAFHGGVVTAGYILTSASSYSETLALSCRGSVVDGINGITTGSAQSLYRLGGNQNVIKNCIGKAAATAFFVIGFENQVINNLGYDSNVNFHFNGYNYFHTVLNNTSAGGVTGFSLTGLTSKTFHNNIAVGASGTNWSNGSGLQIGDNSTLSPHFCEVRNNASQRGGGAMYAGGFERGVAIVGTSVSIPIASPAIVTWGGHGKTTGDNIKLSGTAIGAGLTKYQMYFLGVINADTFYLYDTYANAIASGSTGRQNLTGACTAPTCVSPPSHAIETLTTDCFVDYAAKDFRPALSPATGTSLVGNAYTGSALTPGDDMLGYARPGYNPDGPEYTTLGCFEYDQGHGQRPISVTISITGMISGSVLAIYNASDMSAIAAPATTSGSYSASYTYTGDTNIIVRVRKGSAAGKYLPFEYTGTITSAGFNLNVSQILDPIA